MTPLSQHDPLWKDITINGTSSTIDKFGCLICALAMVADTTPDVVVNKIGFNGADVAWTGLENIGLQLVARDNAYNNEYVKDFIFAHGSCIVRVDFDGSPKTNDTHFVVFIGNGRMYDPWTGKEESTSKYPTLTGFRAVRRIMTDDGIAVKKTDFERMVAEGTAYKDILAKYQVADAQALYNMVAGKDARITDIGNQLGTAQAEVKNKEEIISRHITTIANLTADKDALLIRIKEAQAETTQLGKDKGNLAIEVEQLKVQLETAKQGEFTLTIADLFKMIWNQKITIKKG